MNENWVILAIGFAVAYTAMLAWMLVDCWKQESSTTDKIAWTLAFLVVGFVTLPIYFFVEKCGRAKRKKLANARAKAAVEGRQRHEMQHGLRQRNEHDKPAPQSAWTPNIGAMARWAFGHRQELLTDDLVLQFEIPFGVLDLHYHRGIALERNRKIVAEYSGMDLDLPNVVLPKANQTAPPKLEKSYPALEALAKELSQTQVTKEKLASMILERQQLEQAVKNGEILNDDERKKLFLLRILLGGDGLQPAFETRTVSLEEADKFHAVGGFSFGQVRALLMAQGYSRGDVIQFFERIQGGELSAEEASQFLSDCEEWQQIMAKTQESRDAFFARKRAERQRAKRNNPARN